jgi:bacteriocin biosynthesis cyclodehydratase domain-containing protein
MLKKKIKLRYPYQLAALDAHRLLLRSEGHSELITDNKQILLLTEIAKEPKTMDDLLFSFPEQLSPYQVMGAYLILKKKRYIREEEGPFPPDQTAYWESLGYDPVLLEKTFRNKTISITAVGNVEDKLLLEACHAIGLTVEKDGYLHIVLTDNYSRDELAQLNEKFILTETPWLLMKISGTELYTGPLFKAPETGCWECLRQRLDLNQPFNQFYKNLKGIVPPFQLHATHLLTAQLAINTAILHIVKWLYYGRNKDVMGSILSFSAKTMQSKKHILVKRPQCKVCGDKQDPIFPSPIQINKDDTTVIIAGGYRTVSHEDTFKKYKHHISAISGIIPYLSPYHKMEEAPIYNYASGRNLALQSTSLFWLNLHLRSGNGGKGKNTLQAKTGAICEAIERYSLMYHGNTYSVRATLETLENAVHPNDCMNYSETQFKSRDEINKADTKFYSLVPIPFDSKAEMEWTPVYSLTDSKFNYLPSCYCYAQYPSTDETRLYSYPDSNGCAAGNTIEEAILQGFLELVERDAAAIWWYNQLKRPSINLQTTNNPYIEKVDTYYRSVGRSLHVLDITSDLGIPVFVAISHCLKNGNKVIYAFGAHLDAAIALERAIIELNQLLPVVIKENQMIRDLTFCNWLNTVKLVDHDYLIPMTKETKDIRKDYPISCSSMLHDSLLFCLKTVEKINLKLLVLDLTQRDIGLPVVRIIVPGLRHFWRRTAPGRLYTVPVKMGWLDKEKTESELNPIGIFI